ncbi:MAG: ABC transporter permease subunit [Rickettsiales bacterium TMED254]|nr:ABC transporter permease [Rickettsiales bacterium]RPF76891.1 MAG: ABC transporter permease subunit [Rickettsiales bacterium TMED254]|tara:strand:- start:736 stop:1443 length:708 start_codon:yes stop_codon:yes gene_type:complete
MSEFSEVLNSSARLIFTLDSDFFEIITLSLSISITALVISTLISLPIAVFLATNFFYGKSVVILMFNSFMGLPPVLVGLFLYVLFSNSGPLGFIEILYTPKIMILAQIILIVPIIVSLSQQVLEEMYLEYKELLLSLGANSNEIMATILWDSRYLLVTSILAGLGRSMSEVGAIIIVGGNIAHFTRVMTTSIALETSRGNLELAIALGIILIIISILINLLVFTVKKFAKKLSYD